MNHHGTSTKITGTTIVLSVLIALAVVAATAGETSGQPGARSSASIAGSWKLVVDGSGDVFFGTYNGGPSEGTVTFSSPDNSISLTHGQWKRTGPGTYADTDSGFIYDENGIAILIITFRAEIEVAPGGSTALFNFEFDVADFDGTVVDSGAATAVGTRIRVQPLTM